MRRFQTQDFPLKAIQDNVQQALDEIAASIELTPEYIQVETVVGSDIIVNHRLSRSFKCYEAVRKNAAVDLWDSPTQNNNPGKQLILRANAVATVILKVY